MKKVPKGDKKQKGTRRDGAKKNDTCVALRMGQCCSFSSFFYKAKVKEKRRNTERHILD